MDSSNCELLSEAIARNNLDVHACYVLPERSLHRHVAAEVGTEFGLGVLLTPDAAGARKGGKVLTEGGGVAILR